MSTEPKQKSGPSQVVTLDKAFKLAEQWVNNMTKVAEEEPEKAEPEGRPSRLGLGAKASRQFRPGPSTDPITRKLFANLEAGKRKAAREREENNTIDDGDSEDDLESRSAAFEKKKTIPPVSSFPAKKKKK